MYFNLSSIVLFYKKSGFILDIEDEDKYLAVNDDPTSNLILEAIKNDELRKVKKCWEEGDHKIYWYPKF